MCILYVGEIFSHYSIHTGKTPVKRRWSRVRLRPYLFTAALASRNPSPYTGEASWAIWCMKNSPSFFSTLDFAPFFEDDGYDDDEEEDEEAVEVEGAVL